MLVPPIGLYHMCIQTPVPHSSRPAYDAFGVFGTICFRDLEWKIPINRTRVPLAIDRKPWFLTEHMHHALQPVWFYTPCGWHLVDLLLLNYGLWHVGSLEVHDKSLALLGQARALKPHSRLPARRSPGLAVYWCLGGEFIGPAVRWLSARAEAGLLALLGRPPRPATRVCLLLPWRVRRHKSKPPASGLQARALPAGRLATRTFPSSSRRSRGKSAASPCGHRRTPG